MDRKKDVGALGSWRADPLELLDLAVKGLSGEQRDGQRELTAAVEDAMALGHHLVAEAPTGSGKSLAYLAPAVASGLKVVVATSTIALQSQLVGKDLPVLAEYGSVPFTYALLKGRANYLCRAKLRAAAKPDALFEQPVVAAFSKHLEHFDKFASTSTTGDRAELTARDRRFVVGGGQLHEHRVPGPRQLRRRRRLLRRARARPRPGRRHPRRQPCALLRRPRRARQRPAAARSRHHRRGALLRRQRDQRVRRRPLGREHHPALGAARQGGRRHGDRRLDRELGQGARERARDPRGPRRRERQRAAQLRAARSRRTPRNRDQQARKARRRLREAHRTPRERPSRGPAPSRRSRRLRRGLDREGRYARAASRSRPCSSGPRSAGCSSTPGP